MFFYIYCIDICIYELNYVTLTFPCEVWFLRLYFVILRGKDRRNMCLIPLTYWDIIYIYEYKLSPILCGVVFSHSNLRVDHHHDFESYPDWLHGR